MSVVDSGLSRWSVADTSATLALRRVLHHGLALLVLGCAAATMASVIVGRDDGARALVATVILMMCAWVARRLWRSFLSLVDLAVLATAAMAGYLIPDPSGSQVHFQAVLLELVCLLAIVVSVRSAAVPLFAAPVLVMSLLVEYVVHHHLPPTHLDLSVLYLGVCLAGSVFVSIMTDGARRLETSNRSRLATELEEEMRQVGEDSAAAVRRALHDNVLSALRSIVELGASDPDSVRAASARAVASVKALG